MSVNKSNFEILDGFSADVLAIAAHGKITTEDYETVLIPKFEAILKGEGRVKMLFVFGEDFAGYSAGAAWDDTKFGFLHMRDLAALAVVSDVEWLRFGVKTFSPLIGCPVALFHTSELETAKSWINDWHHDAAGGPEVAADHKLPTLEDKG
ncbi:MAG: STAS/SEC14 domain-containing protein [Pseudomonadota bacterium]